MIPKPSPITYNIFAVFFFGWCVVAGYLLALGDSSPMDQLAFAVCGTLGVYAATMGKMFAWCGRIPRSFFGVPVWTRMALTLIALCAGVMWYTGKCYKENYADTFTASVMKQQYMALEEYAEKHRGTLPPDMRSANVTRYLGIRFRKADAKWYGEPYTWNGKLAGKKIADLPKRASVVVLYSQPITKRKTRVVLFLDGRTDYLVSAKELARLLRESDAAAKPAKPRAANPAANAVH